MNDLLAARSQMAVSLGFHIVFAIAGIGMPVLMLIAEAIGRRRGDATALELAQRWAKGTAILFAVGAVSGTVLSFELGLLWPRFMAFAGPIIGLPFTLEGFAFFLEAIFLGIYLYGWNRVSPAMHLFAGAVVAISGALSGIFVVCANAWMNAPTGFTLVDGRATAIDPVAAMANPASFAQALHMTLAAYASTGFAVAAIHAWLLLRDRASAFHRRAFAIALTVGAAAALAQPLSGDLSARMVARLQPAKLAALEGQFQTERGAPLRIGGWPDEAARTTRHAIEIPRLLSVLAHHDPNAEVTGLEAFPESDWPPVAVVHVAFQIMVGSGLAMALVALIGLAIRLRRRDPAGSPAYLRAVIACGPLGFVATEAGWVVTEVGRQPWIIQGVMRTSEAVTPMTGLAWTFAATVALYLFLAAIVLVLLRHHVFETASPRTDASR